MAKTTLIRLNPPSPKSVTFGELAHGDAFLWTTRQGSDILGIKIDLGGRGPIYALVWFFDADNPTLLMWYDEPRANTVVEPVTLQLVAQR